MLFSAASCGPMCLSWCKMSAGTFGLVSDHRKFRQKVPPPRWGWQALEATKDILQWAVCPAYSLPNSYPDTFSRASPPPSGRDTSATILRQASLHCPPLGLEFQVFLSEGPGPFLSRAAHWQPGAFLQPHCEFLLTLHHPHQVPISLLSTLALPFLQGAHSHRIFQNGCSETRQVSSPHYLL